MLLQVPILLSCKAYQRAFFWQSPLLPEYIIAYCSAALGLDRMKTLTAAERHELAGSYFAPEGLYEYTKSLPFVGKVWSDVKTLVAGEWTEIVINFEVGASGLADGAWIKGTFKFYSVCRSLVVNLLVFSTDHQLHPGLGPFSDI